jgi:hypothetical protein
MNRVTQILSLLALLLLLALPLMHLGALIAAAPMKFGLLVATILWFCSAPIAMATRVKN